jgi:hypothetical protein
MEKRTSYSPQDGPIVWKIKFTRITSSSWPSFVIWYTTDEETIINQAKSAESFLTRLRNQPDVPFFAEQFADCYKVFAGLANCTYQEKEYKEAIHKLNQLVDDLKRAILLLDIFEGDQSNLKIEALYPVADYDVAVRSSKFNQKVPK